MLFSFSFFFFDRVVNVLLIEWEKLLPLLLRDASLTDIYAIISLEQKYISSIYVFSGCQVFSEWSCLAKFTIRPFHDFLFIIYYYYYFALCLIVHKKKTAIQSKHFNQPSCCLSSAPDLEWDHMRSSSCAQQSPNICSRCLFLFWTHMAYGE